MTVEEIEAIAGGYHGDAFRILGPHSVRKKAGQPRWEVRAFLPQAESAEVCYRDQRCAMEKKHNAGFFVAILTGEPTRYTIRARLWDGREVERRRRRLRDRLQPPAVAGCALDEPGRSGRWRRQRQRRLCR